MKNKLNCTDRDSDMTSAYMSMIASVSHDIMFKDFDPILFESDSRGLGYKKYLLKESRGKKLDRNAPCACGSGKKAKKCCGYQSVVNSKIEKEEKQHEEHE